MPCVSVGFRPMDPCSLSPLFRGRFSSAEWVAPSFALCLAGLGLTLVSLLFLFSYTETQGIFCFALLCFLQ